MNSNVTKVIMLIALIAYAVWPADLMPGNPIDDIILLAAYVITNRKALHSN